MLRLVADGFRNWRPFAVIALVSILGVGHPTRNSTAVAARAFVDGRHRGMCYAHSLMPGSGYASHESARSLTRLRDMGVNWISVTPFGFQRDPQSSTFGWVGNGKEGIAETDERVRGAIRQARALGINVMMKPHIWLPAPHWPGSIAPLADSRTSWFQTYEQFILHYALLSEEEGVGALCIGNELSKITAHEPEWRRLITAVRHVYSGALTYAAETDEVFRVPFWEVLDFIGVNGYWPLANAASPERRTLVEAWRPLATRLRDLSTRHGRMVVFTELGYRSAPYGVWRHWEIPRAAAVDLRVQAEAYEAFFEAVWPQRWVAGVYWWKWLSHPGHSGTNSNDFELENKPAEQVVATHYMGR